MAGDYAIDMATEPLLVHRLEPCCTCQPTVLWLMAFILLSAVYYYSPFMLITTSKTSICGGAKENYF